MSAAIVTDDAYWFHTFGGEYVVKIIPNSSQFDSLYHFYPRSQYLHIPGSHG
ncbi:MAG TPA: hypothetical protein VNI77_04215 [Nitrososphaera sp.]|nr:hypothetical protein [Nitrososphaera sp.]